MHRKRGREKHRKSLRERETVAERERQKDRICEFNYLRLHVHSDTLTYL